MENMYSDEMKMRLLGKLLKDRYLELKAEGVRHKDIAVICDVTKATVSRWIAGKMLPDDDKLELIAEAFHVSKAAIRKCYSPSHENISEFHRTNEIPVRHNENGESESSQADDARGGKLPIVTLPVVAVIPCGEPAPMTLADEIIVTTGEYHHLDRIYAYRAAGESMEPYLLEDDYAIVQKFRTPLVLAGGPLSKTVRKSVEKLVNRVVAASLDKKMNLRTLKWLRIINECLCLEAENADGAPDGYAGGYRMIRSDETLAIHGVMVGSHRLNGEEVEETW